MDREYFPLGVIFTSEEMVDILNRLFDKPEITKNRRVGIFVLE